MGKYWKYSVISIFILFVCSVAFASTDDIVGKLINEVRMIVKEHPNKYIGDRGEWKVTWNPGMENPCKLAVRNQKGDYQWIPLGKVKPTVEVRPESPYNGGDKGAIGVCFVCEGPSYPIEKQNRCIVLDNADGSKWPTRDSCFSFGKMNKDAQKLIEKNLNDAIRLCKKM